MKLKELTTANRARLRKSQNRLFANCRNAEDAREASQASAPLEKLAMSQQESRADESPVLKGMGLRTKTPAQLEPYLVVLLAQARGLVRAKHHGNINGPRLDDEAGMMLLRVGREGDYRELAAMIAAVARNNA